MTDRPDILLVEDDQAFHRVYGSLLEDEGYTVDGAEDRQEARDAWGATDYDLVILDLMLPPDGTPEEGLEQLDELLEHRPDCKVVVVSGAGDTEFMVRAVDQGAFDFLTKPVDPDVLEIVVDRALTRRRLEQRVEDLQQSLASTQPDRAMLGESEPFRAAVETAERVAASDLPVLITGEPGTGKELMAETVHEASARSDAPFVAVNCGALPDDLLESTLFGHREGAFTGADEDRAGVFKEADGGTVFLDEIGDMPPELQVELLRTLESGEILPVGADQPERVDVRVVSATNRDLDALMEEGTFREDLYWRVKGAEVALPPLRDRPGDIPLLAKHFLNQAAPLSPDGRAKELADPAERALLAYDWPGNLRELRHEMRRATVMVGERHTLRPDDFSFHDDGPVDVTSVDGDATLQEKVERLERREVTRALRAHDGNRTRAADDLGLSRQGLLNKIERYDIDL